MIHRLSTACMVLWLAACAATAFAAGAANAPAAPASAASAATSPHAYGKKKPAVTVPAKLVDINRATVKELKTLPGIGDAEAQRIVAGRPYGSKADLVTTKVLPAGTYLSIRRLIVAKPSGKPAGKV